MADQIGRVLELLRLSSYILFRKTKNIILNTRIILQLKKPALASHSSVPEVRDSMRQNSRKQGFCSTWKFPEFVLARPAPCLPSPPRLSASSQGCRPSFFQFKLACISTNGSIMGGLVTLDRNPSQYYRDWGYSSILVLHTPPLDKAKRRQHVLDSLVSQVLVRKQAFFEKIGP